jgi:hypothetical protein
MNYAVPRIFILRTRVYKKPQFLKKPGLADLKVLRFLHHRIVASPARTYPSP